MTENPLLTRLIQAAKDAKDQERIDALTAAVTTSSKFTAEEKQIALAHLWARSAVIEFDREYSRRQPDPPIAHTPESLTRAVEKIRRAPRRLRLKGMEIL